MKESAPIMLKKGRFFSFWKQGKNMNFENLEERKNQTRCTNDCVTQHKEIPALPFRNEGKKKKKNKKK